MHSLPETTSRIIKTIAHHPVDVTPIWLMRQAGRYLPEYRTLRAQAGSFLNLCKNPELACEVSLQPLRRFNLDAAIIFSDILTIPDAMGLGLAFDETHGPYFAHKVRNSTTVDNLPAIIPEEQLAYVLRAITLTKQELPANIPLIGFCGSPWTLACYVIEGQGKTDFTHTTQAVTQQVPWLPLLLDKFALAVSRHLQAQVNAGADLVMIFDTWGNLLNEANYQRYSLPYLQKIGQNLTASHGKIPLIVYTRGDNARALLLNTVKCSVISVDARVNLALLRAQTNNSIALQGNLATEILTQPPKIIRQTVAAKLAEFGHGPGHIFNLGHGITPNIPPDHVTALIDAVHELSAQYHHTT